jgi:membrane-associated progesterone receptor component
MADSEESKEVPQTDNDETFGVSQLWQWFYSELTSSPVNGILFVAILYLVYKIFKSDSDSTTIAPVEPSLPRMKKRDFTLKELRKYDGTGPDGRVLLAVLGKIYDMTKGKRFYGPGGPYAGFAGRDASRGLATFNVDAMADEYDDLSDLKSSEIEQVREWELQFSEKYDLVGKLIKPGEEATFYSDASSEDDDDEDPKNTTTEKDKKSQ